MQLIFTIENGNTSVEVIGGDGKNCLAATEPYEKRLGKPDERKPKPEMRQAQATVQQQISQGL